ncbi:MAG: bifunctional hydroxymethylpyrimidine kinase/phosphomethylpyrimidine kinase [Candidatus Brocadiales bacterium]
MNKVMVIGGSDSGGGAGIQADLKTVTALGAFGTTVITAITVQNTLGVQSVHAVPPDVVGDQLDSIMNDIGTDAVKTGMLLNEAIVAVVSEKIREYGIDNVVVDPVLHAKDGSALLEGNAAVKKLISELLPLALIVTPNIPEAEILCGISIKQPAHLEEAARVIHGLGAKNVFVKGGHAPEDWPSSKKGVIEDLFYDGKDFRRFVSPKVDTGDAGSVHGSGCTLASAIATGLALGKDIEEAALSAKEFLNDVIRRSIKVGRGYNVLDPSGSVGKHGRERKNQS